MFSQPNMSHTTFMPAVFFWTRSQTKDTTISDDCYNRSGKNGLKNLTYFFFYK